MNYFDNDINFVTNFEKHRRPLYEEAIKQSNSGEILEIRDRAYYGNGDIYHEANALYFKNGKLQELDIFWDKFDELKGK